MTPKVISYAIAATITAIVVGRHVYRASINRHDPLKRGDLGAALIQGVAAGLFWPITWALVLIKSLSSAH